MTVPQQRTKCEKVHILAPGAFNPLLNKRLLFQSRISASSLQQAVIF
jgi:hypothetical protein